METKKHERWNCSYTVKCGRPYDDYEVLTSMDKEIAVYNEYSNQVIVFGRLNGTTKRHLEWFVSEVTGTYGKEPTVKRLSVKNRDRLFRVQAKDYIGDDYASFYELDEWRLAQAIERGYIDADDAQNASPTALEFLQFAQNQNRGHFYFNGYLIYPPRRDCRATIDSIQVYTPDKEFQEKFKKFAETADIVKIIEKEGYYYAWWD